jgi:endonuclease/exonuclease/phosphatase family metal-dependent hydrolase
MRWTVPAAVGIGVASLAALMIAVAPESPPTTSPELGPVGMASLASSPTEPAEPAEPVEPVSVAAVQAATVQGPSLVVASFNVCKVACAAPAPSWDVRRDRVARVIAETGADVIGIQEATNNATTTARTQAEDIANLAAPAGYRTPSYPIDANECRRPRDAAGQLAGPSPCDNTAMLLFKDATLDQVALPDGRPSAGIIRTSTITPATDPMSAMRSVAWAYLQGANGVGPFLAISVHTDSAKTPEAEASRVAIAGALDAWAQDWNAAHGMAGAPVVLMADLNSYAKRQPNGAQQVLVNAGWTDAATAPTQRNVQFSTINYNPLLGLTEQGFPAKPYEFRTSRKNPVLNATRIDYVMAKGAGIVPLDYEVVIRLNADGTFSSDYQASDHQMVRATLSFPPG